MLENIDDFELHFYLGMVFSATESFELAEMELQRQGRASYNLTDIIDKAVEIRAWLDKNRQGIAERVLAGDKVYKYGNRYITTK